MEVRHPLSIPTRKKGRNAETIDFADSPAPLSARETASAVIATWSPLVPRNVESVYHAAIGRPNALNGRRRANARAIKK